MYPIEYGRTFRQSFLLPIDFDPVTLSSANKKQTSKLHLNSPDSDDGLPDPGHPAAAGGREARRREGLRGQEEEEQEAQAGQGGGATGD